MNATDPFDRDSLVPSSARVHEGHPAGFVSRSYAAVLDLALVALVVVLGYAAWSMARFVLDPHGFSFPTPNTLTQVVAYEAVSVGYLTILWATAGCSVGQQVLGLRVSRRDGAGPGAVQSLARALCCVVFPVGLLWVLVSRQRRALHDVVLHTQVTYAWAPLQHRGPAAR